MFFLEQTKQQGKLVPFGDMVELCADFYLKMNVFQKKNERALEDYDLVVI